MIFLESEDAIASIWFNNCQPKKQINSGAPKAARWLAGTLYLYWESFVINRAAIILRYKAPAVRWINEADPCDDDPGITLDSANDERTVYLISNDDGDGDRAVDRWIKKNYKALIEAELEGWYNDPDLWPKKRTLKLFQEWFAVECHSVILDTVGGNIYDDEI